VQTDFYKSDDPSSFCSIPAIIDVDLPLGGSERLPFHHADKPAARANKLAKENASTAEAADLPHVPHMFEDRASAIRRIR
jgi:hypothetical protein